MRNEASLAAEGAVVACGRAGQNMTPTPRGDAACSDVLHISDAGAPGMITATRRHALDFGAATMKTLCSCGFDCSEFLSHHAIPAGAQFSCPGCELTLSAAEETSMVSYGEANGSAMKAPSSFAAKVPSG